MVSIIDAVQDGNIRKWAIDTYLNNVALGTTYRGYVESTTNKALVLIYKIGDVHKIKIIPISVDKFQLWPREGVIKPFTVQDAEGNNITLHVTEKGGWSYSNNNWVTLDAQTAYPLTEASGTFTAEVINQTSLATTPNPSCDVSFDGSSMTNYYWTDGKQNTYNWRGNPNGHFPLDTSLSIPLLNTSIPSDPSTYTTLDSYIYSGGAILAQAPKVIADSGDNFDAFILGAFRAFNTIYCVALINKVKVPNDGYYEEVYKQVGADILTGYVGETGWVKVGSRKISYPVAAYYISLDGLKYMANDGVIGTISAEGVTYATSVLTKSTGKQSATLNSNGDVTFHNEGSIKLWAELDDVITVTTKADSKTILSGTTSQTTKNVPLKTYGKKASGITVTFQPPPKGYDWAASAVANGVYCSITFSVEAVNGCQGATITDVLQNSVYGMFSTSKNTECNPVPVPNNFKVTAVTDTGVTGISLPYGASNCGIPNTSTTPQKDIIFIRTDGAGSYIYERVGSYGSVEHPTVTWGVSGTAVIIGSATEHQVTIKTSSACPVVSLQVTGSCGSFSKQVLDTNATTLVISGPTTLKVGSVYTTTGGTGAITWSIDSGAINASTGVVTSAGCGTGNITAHDNCGKTASFSANWATGVWSLVSSNSTSACTCGSFCPGEVIQGTFRYVFTIGCCLTGECVYVGVADPALYGASCVPWFKGCPTVVPSRTVYLLALTVYHWVCP